MIRIPLRGGNWNNGANAGLSALNLNNRRSNANNNIGFRPALLRMPDTRSPRATFQRTGKKEPFPFSKRENIYSQARSVPACAATIAAWRFNHMSKTITNLWTKIIDFENLFDAYTAAARGKRYRNSVLEFSQNLEENLITLQNELVWRSYSPGPLREFWINDPKRRLISAPCFRDRVIHHAIVRVIEPYIDRRFIYESHACRTGHGVQLAVKRLQGMTRGAHRIGPYWFYKGDIKGYFPSIDHDILKKKIRRTISCKDTLRVIDLIIDTYREGQRGLPIGALTSQLFANLYLDSLDHYVKECLCVPNYTRYMDDFVLISNDKNELRLLSEKIITFLNNDLRLTINAKSGIGRGAIPFCGYRIYPTHLLPKKSTVRRAGRRLRKLTKKYDGTAKQLDHAKKSIVSFLGYLKHCSSHKSVESILKRIIFYGGTHD